MVHLGRLGVDGLPEDSPIIMMINTVTDACIICDYTSGIVALDEKDVIDRNRSVHIILK